jgi:sulfatase modifying factor 1
MGSDRHYPEEGPAHRVHVDGFWIDRAPVTNSEFAVFVDETNYRTLAERAPNPADYPGIQPEMMRAGSLVFSPPGHSVGFDDPFAWWRFEFGADWKHPYGPASSIDGFEAHPAVHIAYEDAQAYAAWAGKSLPTEAEWEFASRGGLEGADYAWGDTFEPNGRPLANYWQGEFPHQNLLTDGYARTSPVGAFPPNGFGLHDMIGNTWEWTSDWFQPGHQGENRDGPKACCVPRNPRGGRSEDSYDLCTPDIAIPRRVLKGGSHLCAPNYCQRYRPAARYPQPVDTSTSHVGFRCAIRALR